TNQAPVGNQLGIVCYECGRPGHFRKDCPKLRNQNRGNKNGNKTGNQTGSNEATAKGYAIGGRRANLDSNVVTGTFLLNNCYASSYSIREAIGVLCRLPLVLCLMLHHPL
ncbi:putative reverse transcriptase domain-containing protein, partial [Tanacetum coccineum]